MSAYECFKEGDRIWVVVVAVLQAAERIDPAGRKVFCVKLQREMPGLSEVPFEGHPISQKIYESAVLMAAAAALSNSTFAQLPPSRVLTLDAAARDGESHG